VKADEDAAAGGESGKLQALERGLKGRHVQLMAIGGTIGVGLFLGSGRAIQIAGPALILDYVFGGIVIYFLMRALGELILYRPVAGSFAECADEFVGPFTGFATGWSYWLMWIVTCMAQVTAIGIYFHYWFPLIPQWVPALSMLIILYGLNLLSVRVFGEVEFWFVLVKVLTIVTLIGIGVVVIGLKVGRLGPEARISNLWEHGGLFPSGIVGMAVTLQMVMFAYAGVEMIGLTAGEAENPQIELPRAINSVIYCILGFYVGSLLVIMSLIPWKQFAGDVSPFVFVFEKLGIPGAGNVVNLVVITAAASACNSGIYSTGRMIFALGRRGTAPRFLGIINSRRVPVHGISASTAVMLAGVILDYLVPEKAFTWLTSIALVGTLWTWGMIMFAHRGYRRAVLLGTAVKVSYRMPGAPFTSWIVIGGIFLTSVLLWFDPQTRVALYVAPIWFGILAAAYRWLYKGMSGIPARTSE
jgi:amino acid transporter, AAT family